MNITTLKKYFTLFLVLAFSESMAQIPMESIVFENSIWNFGEVDEANGVISHTYTFTNTSDKDFIISSVQASCGCTTPEWSSAPIKPGGTGIIKANFNPTGMLGEAHKSIIIYANFKDNIAKVLEIKGKITSMRFGNTMYVAGQLGYLRLSDDKFDFGNFNKGKKDTTYILIENDGTDTFMVLKYSDVPDYLTIWPAQLSIAPGKTGVVFAEINGAKINEWGSLNHIVKIHTNDRFFFIKEASINAELIDDFSHLSKKELKRAPHMQLDKSFIDFGTFKTGLKKKGQLTITNSGKSTLKIHKTYAVCSCTILKGFNKEIAPGESVLVDVEFDSLFKEGKQTKVITFFTNDPNNPIVDFVIIADVTGHHLRK
jgi:hypothetical protein